MLLPSIIIFQYFFNIYYGILPHFFRIWQKFGVEKKLNLPFKLYDQADRKISDLDNAVDGDLFGDINEYIARLLAVDNDLIHNYYKWRENLQTNSSDQSRSVEDNRSRLQARPSLAEVKSGVTSDVAVPEKANNVLHWLKSSGDLTANELELFMSAWTFLCNQVLISEPIIDTDTSSELSEFSLGNSRSEECTLETISGVEYFTRIFYNDLFLARPSTKSMFEATGLKAQKKVLIVMLQFILKELGDEKLIKKKLADLGMFYFTFS